MSAHRNIAALAALSAEFPEAKLCVTDEKADLSKIKNAPPPPPRRCLRFKTRRFYAATRASRTRTLPEADMVLIAIVGTGGLRPALAAIEAGKDIAVASKEILVMAGEA